MNSTADPAPQHAEQDEPQQRPRHCSRRTPRRADEVAAAIDARAVEGERATNCVPYFSTESSPPDDRHQEEEDIGNPAGLVRDVASCGDGQPCPKVTPLSFDACFALFADAANLSQEGKLNILGVFDAVQVGQLPAIHPRAHLVVRLKGGAPDIGVHTVSLRWENPSGIDLWSSDGDLDVEGVPSAGTEMDFPLIAAIDLPLDEPGGYTMRIAST
jgi:hypothetical protein